MGSVVFSIDAELGWGFHDYSNPPTDRIESARPGWKTLLEIFETYNVPATWAVVGHLLLEDCNGIHADHPAVDGWFARERGAWRDRRDLRFGPDLVEAIAEADAGHEIGCHSFSHVLFDDPRTTRDIARAELETAIEVARTFDIEYESFVFPRNAVGHRELLAETGFSCYRGAADPPESRLRRPLEKLLATIDPQRVELVEPTVDKHGLVDVPPSLFCFRFEGMPRAVVETLAEDPIVRQAKHAIDRASRTDGVFHAWLHPNNLQAERDARRMESIIAYAAEKQATSDLRIETMADVAERAQ
ncbi:polysaccharide deacetylase family protein [Natronomonas halophila]|uniref:polysaccharide deacetylase family protein n=1 Tax=Natronomonas halophila TaxID=2747817 RepID=UPI0015B57E5D|nr:polysaccharide deacetylase family protein [Natronomonas halophila]QLD87135.1 polysaccharide deacetylase family protein [Natronomonas halophila]